MNQPQGPTQIQINEFNKISNKSNSPKQFCCDFLSLIFNFSIWIFLILIKKDSSNYKGKVNPFSLFSVLLSYILYLITEFYSSTYISLKNKEDKLINEKMGDIYNTKPTINGELEWYHNEKAGQLSNKIITHRESFEYTYLHCRDISGNLKLELFCNNTYYVILTVVVEVIFEDNSMFSQYNNMKNDLINRNRFRDNYYSLSENIEIKGAEDIRMIKLQEKEAYLIGRCWFIFFTIFSLATLYKIYICIISVYQTVTIKKLISNNNSLINDERYNEYNPSLQFLDKTFRYRNNNVNENTNDVLYNNAQRVVPVNNNNINANNINVQVEQNDSERTKDNTNISSQEQEL